uniref:Uncharacterized protein n=1 Tax=Timema monikensis TaxID=170555 RepID=A0A7R9DZG5_9NEOP|nr:unnamed protein product [Timema monikensis]
MSLISSSVPKMRLGWERGLKGVGGGGEIFIRTHCNSQKNLEASGVELGNRVTFWFYTVVAPKILRPNTEYHVAVTTQGASQPTRVTVNVGGKQDAGGMFRTSDTVTVEPYTTHIVKLEGHSRGGKGSRPMRH